MSSARKRSANRENGKKGTGAKSQRGRDNSKKNALKHRLTARDCHLTEEEKAEMEALGSSILGELMPSTPLQREFAEDVVHCCWIRRLASAFETTALQHALDSFQEDGPSSEPPQAPPQWYGVNRRVLQEAIKFLETVKLDVQRSGHVRGSFRDEFVARLGQDFYNEVTEWESAQFVALQMAYSLSEKSKIFNLEGPTEESEGEGAPEGGKKPSHIYVPDPKERVSMMVKLIAVKQRHLLDIASPLLGGSEGGGTKHAHALELAHRYQSGAQRRLYRAVEQYRMLKN